MNPPDLRAAEAWLANKPALERKKWGQWSTPWWLVERVVDRVIAQVPWGERGCDPSCGDGRWLVALHRRRPDLRLVGMDKDPEAIAVARRTLEANGVKAELIVGDALGDPGAPEAFVWVGNPPYIRPQNLEPAVRKDLWGGRFSVMTDKVDLSAAFLQRATERAQRVAMVTPSTWVDLTSYAALRALLEGYGVQLAARLHRDTFPKATVFPMVLVMGTPDDLAEEWTVDGATPLGKIHRETQGWTLGEPTVRLEGRPLGELVRFSMGVLCGDQPRYVHSGRQGPDDRQTCRGRDVGRFEIADAGLFIRYNPAEMLARVPYCAPKSAALFDVPEKLVISGTSGRRLHGALDRAQLFPLDSCYIALPQGDTDLEAVLGFLLSPQVTGWYGERHRAARVKAVELARIPLPDKGWGAVADAVRKRDEGALERAVAAAYR